MELKDRYLTQDGNNDIINSKIPFGSRTKADCSSENLEKALEFSYNMTFGTKGEHRSNRSGGILNRNLSQQFVDILVGKLLGISRMLLSQGLFKIIFCYHKAQC